jgi:hypothetical protein
MKVVDGFADARVNAVIEAASESKEDPNVRAGRHIRGCSMMYVPGLDREVVLEASRWKCNCSRWDARALLRKVR